MSQIRDRGFPAHAGMDPSSPSRLTAPCWLPRARGDGPLPVMIAAGWSKASPRTRGWTPDSGRVGRGLHGFPAHAGMDPSTPLHKLSPLRLPRARGDGPEQKRAERASPGELASPRTRGWTAGEPEGWTRYQTPGTDRSGFPAHAGMDPRRAASRLASPRLPRARGDGPCHRRSNIRLTPASPRTRGWTLIELPDRRTNEGFPAHAGMDPPPLRP